MPEQPGHGGDHADRGGTGGAAAPADLAARAGEYGQRLGWPTRLAGTELHLLLGRGLVGVALANPGVAEEILGVLTRRGLDGPVVVLPGSPARWVFLAGADPAVDHTAALVPPGVDLVRDQVALPPSRTPHGRVAWARPPSPHRALPSALVVLAAARLTIG
ncbi:hypothetical protein [Goodfellowiella coeruleoviolacea]|uniref:Uncharacterized protein n=1 Tax=Goodfellowiella coeruleoviolacea TaxID=334858 RepID=A0AAE3GQD6_9PSEU|nr:hypothetical protein [Goodfellowiella coeruleoviolacea]MCP2170233.1 hypothetical protein [Goodfellowiella coeruleoviolacea]